MRLGQRLLGRRLFAALMRSTFYGHFVAGENRAAIRPTVHRMHTFGVKSILDYSAEEDVTQTQEVKKEMRGSKAEAHEPEEEETGEDNVL